jgi:hypothetical protein
MKTTRIYNGRAINFRKSENILIVWLSENPLDSFEVKRRENGEIFAYGFEGDFSVTEIKEAKRIFECYEAL